MSTSITDKLSYCQRHDTGRAFLSAIEYQLRGVEYFSSGLCPACDECQANYGLNERELSRAYESGRLADEGGFSCYSCDSCGSNLAGNQYDAHGYVTLDDGRRMLCHFSICEDCLLYHANGDLPERWEG